ncbi:mechanosensitive ion channel protein [Rhodoferax koreense]|uniref:Mechanosensitive ion channel protein n=1 Tax=Rhodoferax koreensis TaxID=1842727 RepID=A0A1P8JY45_9BURK|nr:mechanosensitive ion channel domain-containing protein [Rhodoferax koreense]APW38601.1 mechanosensitive ion channel protein [Rhodoferax koreense]
MDSLQTWLAALTRPSALAEGTVIAACVLAALGLAWALRRGLGWREEGSILFGRRLVDGVLFPLLLLCLAYVAQALVAHRLPLAVFRIAIPVLISLAVIRLGVKVLQVAFRDAPVVRVLERTISWVAWLAVVLWVSGLLPVILEQLDQIRWKVGGSTLSVRTMIEGGLTAGTVLIITLWISSAIEARLLHAATGGELSLRKAVANATRASMLFVGLLVALSSVGIDLTALSVLGGAVGVGIGFGLQKLASNYVSGFVILAERSMRIGDHVRIDGFEGRITDINARYTVVSAPNGRESIVPNEMLITQRVENWSLNNRRIAQNTVVSVGYDSDVDRVMTLLADAARAEPRVLAEPAPSVTLSNFGADGLEFTVGYWIEDPENGLGNLRSAINLGILRALRAGGIEVPYPQRVVHVQGAGEVVESNRSGTLPAAGNQPARQG